MIHHLEGKVVEVSDEYIVLEQGGVGYLVYTSRATREALANAGLDHEVKLYTHLQLREDGLALYGFSTVEERRLFQMLMTVSGVGPKVAISILAAATPRRLQEAILSGNTANFQGIKGIGKKTAERLIVELKDKIAEIPLGGERVVKLSTQAELALQALTRSLGFTEREAREAIVRVQADGEQLSAEELIKRALQSVSRR